MSSADVLVQVHIPKCAGTSISDWMRRAALAGLTTGFGSFYPSYILTPEKLWEAGLNDPRVVTVSAHNIRTFDRLIHDRRMRYFTLVRDPRKQTVSFMRYIIQERDAFGVPPTVASSLPDVAAWLFTQFPDVEFRKNRQTNHLALHTWCAATGGRCRPDEYGAWSERDHAAYRRDRLDIAKETLAGFLVAGTVERLVETMTLVRARSAELGIVLPPVEAIEYQNVTRVFTTGELPWDEDSRAGQALRTSTAVDEQLYAYAGGLLDATARDGKGQFA
jgi:hypothetical protein